MNNPQYNALKITGLIAVLILGSVFISQNIFLRNKNNVGLVMNIDDAISAATSSLTNTDKQILPPLPIYSIKPGQLAPTQQQLDAVESTIPTSQTSQPISRKDNLFKYIGQKLKTILDSNLDNTLRAEAASQGINEPVFITGGGISFGGKLFSDTFSSNDGQFWNQMDVNMDYYGYHGPWIDRNDSASIFFNNKIYIIGGYDGSRSGPDNGCKNDIWSSANGGKNWRREVFHAPWKARSGHTVTLLGKTLYLIGGTDCFGNTINDIWKSTNGTKWTQVSTGNPLLGRVGHASFAYNGKLYVVGGFNVNTGQYNPNGYANDIISSPDGINWTIVNQDASWEPRADHTALMFNNSIYVIGGFNFNIGVYITPWPGFNVSSTASYFDDVWKSDDGGITWIQITDGGIPHWSARSTHVSFVKDGFLYVAGGINDTSNLTPLNDVWKAGLGGKWTWVSVTPNASWQARASTTGVVTPFSYVTQFPTLPLAPKVVTYPATSTNTSNTTSTLNLSGYVDTQGNPTAAWFEYSNGYDDFFSANNQEVGQWWAIRNTKVISLGTVSGPITITVPNVFTGFNYKYRLVAQNDTGITYSTPDYIETACPTLSPSVSIVEPNPMNKYVYYTQNVAYVFWGTCNIPNTAIIKSIQLISVATGLPVATVSKTINDGSESISLNGITSGDYKIKVTFGAPYNVSTTSVYKVFH